MNKGVSIYLHIGGSKEAIEAKADPGSGGGGSDRLGLT